MKEKTNSDSLNTFVPATWEAIVDILVKKMILLNTSRDYQGLPGKNKIIARENKMNEITARDFC